jgi:hypothetical protein
LVLPMLQVEAVLAPIRTTFGEASVGPLARCVSECMYGVHTLQYCHALGKFYTQPAVLPRGGRYVSCHTAAMTSPLLLPLQPHHVHTTHLPQCSRDVVYPPAGNASAPFNEKIAFRGCFRATFLLCLAASCISELPGVLIQTYWQSTLSAMLTSDGSSVAGGKYGHCRGQVQYGGADASGESVRRG